MELTSSTTEVIINPLQQSNLNKKGLCDYVINVASGCLHGCTFCYVPSTPAIRTRTPQFQEQGVKNPQLDWGKYLFVRNKIPSQLEQILCQKKSWISTLSGKGVVLLCSGTDPYQNKQTAKITREVVSILLEYDKRIRILTRSPLWLNDLDILCHKNVTVGMSLPHLDDELSRKIESFAPLPSSRYKALEKGHREGCRLYVAVAPTPPMMKPEDFKRHLGKIMALEPEVIFWEPINARGANGQRMRLAGLDFVDSISCKKQWAEYFLRQWNDIVEAAIAVGCQDKLHIWADSGLKGYLPQKQLESWFYRPTIEKW